MLNRHILNDTASIIEAMKRLNDLSGSVMVLLVVDADGRMTGSLTDGDVRRALIRGVAVDAPVTEAMNRHFRHLDEGSIDIERLRRYRLDGIHLIPVIRPDGTIARLIDTRLTRTILPLQAILMAGGKGERLRPLTIDTPKPLLDVGGKAIIDYNVEALAAVGVDDIYVTTNYLAPLIEAHFEHPVAGVRVKCVREEYFLGTIGAASLVPHTPGGDTVVMNSDLLTTISFEDMYLTHRREQADITIAAVPYNVSVPYAILSTEGKRVTALSEKPRYSYYANGGIYIFSNEVLSRLDGLDHRLDAPDFIEQCMDAGRRVVYYPIDGTWIDIGSPSDYAHARQLMEVRGKK